MSLERVRAMADEAKTKREANGMVPDKSRPPLSVVGGPRDFAVFHNSNVSFGDPRIVNDEVAEQENISAVIQHVYEKQALSAIPTYMLVNELATREGVEERNVEPHKDRTFSVEGPARVLIVID